MFPFKLTWWTTWKMEFDSWMFTHLFPTDPNMSILLNRFVLPLTTLVMLMTWTPPPMIFFCLCPQYPTIAAAPLCSELAWPAHCPWWCTKTELSLLSWSFNDVGYPVPVEHSSRSLTFQKSSIKTTTIQFSHVLDAYKTLGFYLCMNQDNHKQFEKSCNGKWYLW